MSWLRATLARLVCSKRGHIAPTVKWGISRRMLPCERCGDPVRARIDWDGHP